MSEENIKDLVRDLLRDSPRSRNSREYAYLRLLKKMGFKIYLNSDEIKDYPKIESVTRAIRHIQNTEGLYLPTKHTEELRKEKEKDMKSSYCKSYMNDYPVTSKYLI